MQVLKSSTEICLIMTFSKLNSATLSLNKKRGAETFAINGSFSTFTAQYKNFNTLNV